MLHTTRLLRILPALVLLVYCERAVAAGAKETDTAAVILPGGVADAAGKTGYLANDKGGIDAVNLETGELLWDSKEPGKPLIVRDQRLIIQVPVKDKPNQVRILALDVSKKGKRVLESKPVVFPDWVAVGLTHGRTFSSRGWIHKGDLLLVWNARAFYAGGAKPTPEIERRARKNAAGVARVNLESGKVDMLDADKAPKETGPKLPKELESIKSQQYWTGTDWKTTPIVAGKIVAALALKQAGGRQTLNLKRWDLATGKEVETVSLLTGKSLWPQLAPDGRHLFVHQALVREQLPEGDYAWWVFSMETGKQVAKLPFVGGSQGMTVIGPRAYFMVAGERKGGRPFGGPGAFDQPRLIWAVDLKTGKKLWERAIEPHRELPPLP
jgi:outer membrane protein assembly factor BamB